MLKNALNSFSSGFFRSLGRMVAYFLIGAVLGYILLKLGGTV